MASKLSLEEKEIVNLLTKIAKSCESALSKLYDRTSSLVFGLVNKMLSDKDEAEEVVLDIYMQIWDKANSYSSDRGKPLSWIMMLTRSRSIDKFRSGSKRKSLEQPIFDSISDISQNPEDKSIEQENKKLINNALAELSDNQRKAIELAYFYGLTQVEIADTMNYPLGTIKSWIRLGMQKLREILIKK